MQSKKYETDKLRIAKNLTRTATRSVSLEEFGRRVFQQVMQYAAQQLEKSPMTELEQGSIEGEVSLKIHYGIVKPPSSAVGIGFGLAMNFGIAGEVWYLEDVTDLSLVESWWRLMERVD